MENLAFNFNGNIYKVAYYNKSRGYVLLIKNNQDQSHQLLKATVGFYGGSPRIYNIDDTSEELFMWESKND